MAIPTTENLVAAKLKQEQRSKRKGPGMISNHEVHQKNTDDTDESSESTRAKVSRLLLEAYRS